ncbi:CE1 family esterase [Halovulum sp. GXIMD14793]
MRHILFAFLLFLPTASPAFDRPCPADTGCSVDGPVPGRYHMAVPENWAPDPGGPPQPVLVFFHGHASSGQAQLRGGMAKRFTEAGYIVIAPDGAARAGRNTLGWPARPDVRSARDDVAFTEAMLDDVMQRLGVTEIDLLVSGFSSGGSMAWMFACYSERPIGAVVALAGALRRPIPEDTCPGGPRRMLHIHGFADKTVPLEGRPIHNWHQGDVFEGLSLLRATNQCASAPDTRSIEAEFWCRSWTSCKTGQEIRMCLTPGGHGMPRGWVQRAMDWHRPPEG